MAEYIQGACKGAMTIICNQDGSLDMSQPNTTSCECHEFTQARWKMSIQGQMGVAMQSRAERPSSQPACSSAMEVKHEGAPISEYVG